MSIHQPKNISSTEGLGINTTKSMRRINESVSIGTEVWNDMKEPWVEGRTVIAKPGYIWTTKWETGKPYIITKFQDAAANLIAVYCDVARPIEERSGGFSFVDLYLDVWQVAGQDPVILDEDELKQAVIAGYITEDEAHGAKIVAEALI